jgi:hypothetical protein
LLLPLIWFCMGILIGFMVYMAHLQPTLWSRSKALDLLTFLLLGATLSLCSGWLGVLLLGRLFSIATALWITIASVIILPWLIVRLQIKFKRSQRTS